MATSLKARLKIALSAILAPGVTNQSGGVSVDSFADVLVDLVDGTATGQADRIYAARRTLAASGNETLDLAGSLADVFGTTISFAKVKLILIRNVSTVAATLEFGPNASNGAGIGGFWKAAANKSVIPKDNAFRIFYDPAGWSVTAGSADLLYVENINGSNAATYDIVIIGTSA